MQWLTLGNNLKKWSGTNGFKMEMWEKRVLLTTLFADVYDVVCKKWDFEKMGSKQGMRLTLDGSDDDLIEFRGLDGFWFSEEDAGDFDPATISDVEEDDQSDLDSDAEVTEDVGEPDDAVLDDDMEEAGELTAQEHLDRFSAVDPTLAGFSIVSVVPAITNDLIGKPILFKFDAGAGGTVWYKGKVKMKHKHTCDCGPVAHCDLNFDVKYSDGVYPQQLRSENDSEGYGSHNLWVLLEKR
jgi:hypothetical protein